MDVVTEPHNSRTLAVEDILEPITITTPDGLLYLFIDDRGRSMWRTADAGKDLKEPWHQAFTLRP